MILNKQAPLIFIYSRPELLSSVFVAVYKWESHRTFVTITGADIAAMQEEVICLGVLETGAKPSSSSCDQSEASIDKHWPMGGGSIALRI